MNTQGWIIVGIALGMCGISFYLFQRDSGKITKAMIIYSLIATLAVVGITIALVTIYDTNSFVFNLKRVVLLALLWPIAYIDFKEYRIPNAFILMGLISRIIIVFPEIFMGEKVVTNILLELIAAGILILGTVLCKLMIKNAIGAGDIKLFIVMGLLLGLDGTWSAVFMSLIISFFVAVGLLVTKKKSRNDNIPFGPAIALGTYISIFLTGM